MKHFYTATLLFLFLSTISSCRSQRESLVYFEDIKGLPSDTINITIPEVKIEPDDQLLITVTSEVPEAAAPYNNLIATLPVQTERSSVNYNGIRPYLVNAQGDITFPLVGSIHVAGLTTIELSKLLTSELSREINDPVVRVELYNMHVNVLGEVQKPGRITADGERVTILDALAEAGDLTPYGVRESVLVIRQEDGVNKFYRVDLTSSDMIKSPAFYMKQNDVVIVEPNSIRKSNSRYNQDNAFKLSLASTIISASSVIVSLVIALALR